MLQDFTRHTFWLLLTPSRFVKPDLDWNYFTIPGFNDAFDWRRDDWDGLKDVVQPVEETRNLEEGDCEDYAVLIASYLLSETTKPVRLAILKNDDGGHVVCYTDEAVYSSGTTHRMTFRRYCAEESYTALFVRSLQ